MQLLLNGDRQHQDMEVYKRIISKIVFSKTNGKLEFYKERKIERKYN